MKNAPIAAVMLAVVAMLGACSPDKPPTEVARPVRTAEIRYDAGREASRYAATVQSRYEVDQAFRVGGKVGRRLVDVGQTVREGDVLAVLDDADYRLAEEAASQQWAAAVTQARQAASDRQRLGHLKTDGSVSDADDERAHSGALTAQAAADAQARQLELARNRLKYTALRASRSGVVTAVRFEVGQVVAEGLPMVAIADPGTPEIVVDVPEDQLSAFREAKFKATLASAPNERFDVTLRELSPQAAAQSRTYRARMKPASALTQSGGRPALWVVRHTGNAPVGSVELVPVQLHGYRNDEVLVSGPPAGVQVVTAGVQKMAPGLKVALPASLQGSAITEANTVATR